MTAYIYREDCGEFEERFEAESDDAAEDRVLSTFRSAGNPGFDGDSARLLRLDWDDEDKEFIEAGICDFAGENMIEDVDQLR